MQFKNTPVSYGVVTKTFHWVIALAIIMMLVIGFRMGGIENLADKIWVYGIHKSIGITILTLAVLRILWHIYSKKPPYVASLTPVERMAAHFLHFCLYAAMLAMPLSGWIMSSAAGRAVSFFGLFMLPDLVEKNEDLASLMRNVHFYLAWLLIAGIVVHFAAALKHHFITRDATLKRMLPFTKPEPPNV